MTDEPEQDRATPRRKFDDVASLFGTIVPAPGAALRPADDYPVPFAPRLVPQPGPVEPPAMPPPAPPPVIQPEPPPMPVAAPAPAPVPKAAPRPRPTEVPWPDAFEPRPNYRRREPRNWSWLLLIPVGFVAAVGITMLDPRTIRNWIEANVLHRTSEPATTTAPLLTVPPIPQPPAEVPTPYPALPTSPVPPAPDLSPPSADPAPAASSAPAAAAPAGTPAATPTAAQTHITIQYRRNIPGADGEARRIAAILQSFGGSIELHPNATTVRVPTINYYNPSDKAAATSLATALANEAVSWTVHAGTAKNPPGTLDVWLP